MAYRQNSQQRCLSRILEADHRDVHLRRPAIGSLWSASCLFFLPAAREILGGEDICFCWQQIVARPSACIDPTAPLTRTTAAANRTRV